MNVCPSIAPATDASALVQLGRNTLLLEAAALMEHADRLGDEFVAAVTLMTQTPGRIIVTGIGKSGHIARKIASTFSSIGRSAIYVHPSEASHGDLGMIQKGDCLLALSNSGETPELTNIVSYCEELEVPMLALVGRASSTLARHAAAVLSYGRVQEACANGLAPTTSTTLALAIGDALAVGMMHVLGTTREHFHIFHPGGTLGASLTQVRDLMHVGHSLPVVAPDMKMQEVVVVMSSKGFGVAIVQDSDGQVEGLITDGDMRRHIDSLWNSTARDLLHGRPQTVGPLVRAAEALELMTAHGITCLLVEEDSGLLGLLHIHDCLRAGV